MPIVRAWNTMRMLHMHHTLSLNTQPKPIPICRSQLKFWLLGFGRARGPSAALKPYPHLQGNNWLAGISRAKSEKLGRGRVMWFMIHTNASMLKNLRVQICEWTNESNLISSGQDGKYDLNFQVPSLSKSIDFLHMYRPTIITGLSLKEPEAH